MSTFRTTHVSCDAPSCMRVYSPTLATIAKEARKAAANAGWVSNRINSSLVIDYCPEHAKGKTK